MSRTLARRAALRALAKLERDERPLSALLDREELTPDARPFARELASGVARHRARLDNALAPLLRRPLEALDAPVRAALRLAAYERILLQTPAHSVVNEYAEAMKREKLTSAAAFVNAVARRLPNEFAPVPGDDVTRLSIEHSHPRWLVERYLKRFGLDECEALLRANNAPALLSLRVNPRHLTREAALQTLRADNIEAHAGKVSPQAVLVNGGSPIEWQLWRDGALFVQDEAAQLVGLFAAPAPNTFIIDAASAPGGKSTHLCELSGGVAVLACDVAEGRLKLVRDNAARLGFAAQIETRAGDFRVLAPQLPLADLVLLDAPCLGTGTLRRRPDAKWRKTPAQLEELIVLQRELLQAAARVVKPGGTLVYSTCSLEPEENEEQARAFSAAHSNFGLQTATPSELTRFITVDGFLQTLPHRDGCDGTFAARWTRLI